MSSPSLCSKKRRVHPASVTSIITSNKGKKCGDCGKKDF
ncbi:unnamed protein product [Brassica napus]|uniref:(rape) hypothetical protein n=1 Tax=Brassica napus TaxID=3708 RepID=A0A816M014_BRANA|nr:unnamed protein product [Brassica napus]